MEGEAPGTDVAFIVPGDPATKGSFKAFVVRGRAHLRNDCKAADAWTQACWFHGSSVAPDVPSPDDFEVRVTFFKSRPKALGKKRQGARCNVRPDPDKILRLLLDSMTGLFYRDDGQVTDVVVRKRYADFGEPARAEVRLINLTERDKNL